MRQRQVVVGAHPRRQPKPDFFCRNADVIGDHARRENDARQTEMKQRPQPAGADLQRGIGIIGLSHENLPGRKYFPLPLVGRGRGGGVRRWTNVDGCASVHDPTPPSPRGGGGRRGGDVYRVCATRAGARAMTASSWSRSLSKSARVAPSSTRPRGSFTFIGSTKRSLMRISKCTCEPVDIPVEPTKPMIWPWRTLVPTSRPRANGVMWP